MNSYKIYEEKDRLRIEGLKDFNLRDIFECGQAFRWENTGHSYIAITQGKVAEFEMDDFLYVYNSTKEDFENIWAKYFDLDRDYSKIKDELSNTKAYAMNESLKKAIEFGKGIRILNQDRFEMIISFIISANNQIPRIKKSIELICQNYGKLIENYKDKNYYTFPEPEKLSKVDPMELKEICRVGFRNERIVQTSKIYFENPDNFSENLDEMILKENLLALPGVGPKVCDCILLFGYAKEKTFPVDVWVKRLMETLYLEDSISNNQIMKYADDLFGDLKGYAQQYLFYYARENAIGK